MKCNSASCKNDVDVICPMPVGPLMIELALCNDCMGKYWEDRAQKTPMRTDTDIKDEINKILAEGYVQQPAAKIFTNPNLAMIQIDQQSRLAALRWVLGERNSILPDAW